MASTLHVLRAILRSDVDGFARNMAQAAKATEELSRKWVSAGQAVGRAAARIGAAVTGMGATIAVTFGKFEATMVRAGAVTRTLGTRDFALLEQAARRMGETTVFSASQAAEAIEVMGLAGLKTTEIIDALPGALQLAAAGAVDIATAANSAAKIMRAFGAEASDLTHINDVLVGTFTRANTDLLQLTEAMKPVAPVSKALGVSLEDTAAIIAKMSDAGFQGGLAGTSLRNILQRLAGAVPAATKQLRGLGIETIDLATNKMRPLLDILQDIEQAGLTEGQLLQIFGARGGPQLLALLEAGIDDVRQFSHELDNMGGIAEKIANAQLSTLSGAWKLFNSQIESFLISSGEQIGPKLRQAADELQKFLQANKAEIVRLMTGAVNGLVTTFTRLIQASGTFVPQMIKVADVFGRLTGRVLDLAATHPQITAFFLAFKAANLFGITQAVIALSQAIRFTLITALSSLKAALASLGIGLVIIAIGALISKFDEVKAWVNQHSNIFGGFVAKAKEAWDRISQAVIETAQRLWDDLRPVIMQTIDIIVNDFIPVVTELALAITDVLGVALEGWVEILADAAAELKEIMPIVRPIAEFFAGAFAAKVQTLAFAWDKLRIAIQGAVDGYNEALSLGLADPKRTRELDAQVAALQGRLRERERAAESAREERRASRQEQQPEDEARPETRPRRPAVPSGATPSMGAQDGRMESVEKGIADAIKRAEMAAVDRQTPGFSNFRDILGMEGIKPEEVTRLLAAQEGVTPGMAQDAGALFAQAKTPEELDRLAQALAMTVNQINQLKQAQEQSRPILDGYRDQLRQIKEEGILSKDQLDGFANQALALNEQVMSGKISLEEFSKGMADLTNATNQAVQAAKKKEAQEKREALIRGDFKGAGLDFKSAVRDQIAAIQMQRFQQAAGAAAQRFAAMNGILPRVSQGFNSLQQGMGRFGERMREAAESVSSTIQQVDPSRLAEGAQQFQAFFASRAGQIASLQNQIAFLQQRLQFLDRARDRIRVENQIGELMGLLRELLQPVPSPIDSVNALAGIFRDPGLTGSGGGPSGPSGNLTINFNSLAKLTPEDQRMVADAFEEEMGRRGWR